MRKLITACMALAAFLAFAALPSIASANNAPEVVENGVKVVPPVEIVGTNVGETLMTDANGNVLTRCTTAVMKGTLNTNTGTSVEGTINTAVFGGTGSQKAGYPEPECTGSFGNVSVEARDLPWCLRSTATMTTHEFQVRGGKCSEAAKPIKFNLDSTTVGLCEYERATAIPGTYTTSTTSSTLSISKVEFKKIGGGFFCPGPGFLDMTFKIETGNGTALGVS